MKKRRNRHTGVINAFKNNIIKKGRKIETKDGRIYYVARIGANPVIGKPGNTCVVRLM